MYAATARVPASVWPWGLSMRAQLVRVQVHTAFLAFPAAAALPALEPLRQASLAAAKEAAADNCPSQTEAAVLHALRVLCTGGSVDVSVRSQSAPLRCSGCTVCHGAAPVLT